MMRGLHRGVTEPRPFATLSIAATDGIDWGVVVTSRLPAVGSVVPRAIFGVGAVATQGAINVGYKTGAMELLRAGRTSAQTVDALIAEDKGRKRRQLGVVDKDGDATTYTGSECGEWAGGRTAHGCACQGDPLVGPDAVDSILNRFEGSTGALAGRLLEALVGYEEVVGDRLEWRSAALLVDRRRRGYGKFDDRMVDLRVDDHSRPIGELYRLLELWRLHFEPPAPESLLTVGGSITARLRFALHRAGRLSEGASMEQLWQALDRWIGEENFQERTVQSRDLIDPLVLAKLEALTPTP